MLGLLSRWRQVPHRLARVWGRSLQFRTVLLSVLLSGAAVLLINLYMSYSIGSSLFDSRRDQVLAESARATAAAQRILDASDASDRVGLQNVLSSVRTAITSTTSSRLITVYRAPGQDAAPAAPTPFSTPLLAEVISSDLREAVVQEPGVQHWQSVQLRADDIRSPGIVIGSGLDFPTAGRYELYIGYDLRDDQQTLSFVQQTLVLGGLALIGLIAAVTAVVVRLVVAPVRTAAVTSSRIAAGELDVRLPARGQDEIATLARSFNDMADSLQARIRELADLSQVQQRFVSDVSHELRTPLTTIRLAGDVLHDQRKGFPPGTARAAELLHTQVERFELLLSDLLEISRYDAGSVQLDVEPTNLVHLAEDAADGMRDLAASKGSDLRVVAPGGHFEAQIDPRRVRRILRNLIGNAIEHGEGRPIVLAVDSNEEAVALSVRDYGLGIEEKHLTRVFERFWRADPSRKRTIGGTGLGLPISLEDAALHGGALEVWSRRGQGTCFRLTLPRVPRAAVEFSPLPLPPVDAEGSLPVPRESAPAEREDA